MTTLTVTLEVPKGTTEESVRHAIASGAGWTLDYENFGNGADARTEKALVEALTGAEAKIGGDSRMGRLHRLAEEDSQALDLMVTKVAEGADPATYNEACTQISGRLVNEEVATKLRDFIKASGCLVPGASMGDTPEWYWTLAFRRARFYLGEA